MPFLGIVPAIVPTMEQCNKSNKALEQPQEAPSF
jgi:hypothetical protein